MRLHIFIALLFIIFVCSACPEPRYESAQKKLEDNNMDFPDLELNYYKGISYKLSDLFDYSYNDEYVISDDAETSAIYDIDVYFSIEKFSRSDAEQIQYGFDEEVDLLNAVHDHYIHRRSESLMNSTKSIKKEVPETVGFDGLIQVVHGSSYSYSDQSSYFTSTLKIGNEYFVFQLIGKRENMGYLYDDFIDILSSVEK